MIRLALFSDIHGKFLLPFKLVDHYQQKTGRSVDLILQCGDLGAYPDLDRLDKATIKHAQTDRDELGFHDDFISESPEVKALLERLDLDMICVRGNHEDHDFLDRLEATHPNAPRFPIDVYQRVWICKTGHLQTFEKDGERLSFVGVGRIGDRKGRNHARFIQDYERKVLERVKRSKEDYDILISHDKAASVPGDYGMPELRDLLDHTLFHYHFFGHTGQPYTHETDANGLTHSIKIKELEFGASGILPESCMIVLEKTETGEFHLEVVDHNLILPFGKYRWRF